MRIVKGKGADTVDGNEQLDLYFDENPVVVGGFQLRSRSVEPLGKPTIRGWQDAFQLASASEQASPFWVGGLLNYAETRTDWREKIDQAKAVTKLAEQTLHNMAHVCRRVTPRAQRAAPTFSHAAEVASFKSEGDQVEWLEKATGEGWTARELRESIRAAKRTKVLEGQADLEGMYRVIYADPPWLYHDSGATPTGALGKAARHYQGMSVDDLGKLPVEAHALPNSILFLWATAPVLLQNPGPRDVLEAWGFTYKGNVVWDKVLGLPSHYGNQVTHEHLIYAVKGSCLPDVPLPHDKSILVERRGDEHSAKPVIARQWIMKHWTRGPYLELFGRARVESWTVFGNDARLWAKDSRAS